ncbi:MAG: acyl-CoA dehydrogenase family protein [Myxococcota bacterium]
MDFTLNDAQQTVLDSTRRFATEVLAPEVKERERAHRTRHETIRALGEQGLLGVNVPAELGGSEAGVVSYAAAVREIARVDASISLTMCVTNMVAEVLVEFGTDEQVRRHVPKLVSGEYFAGAFALSETGSGSDASGMKTRAEKRGDRWILNGEKMWITSGDDAGVIVVWAKTGAADSKAISCFLLEKDTPGLSAGKPEEKMGMLGSHTVSLSFQDVELPESALLGELGRGFKIAMMALDGGRIGISAQALGIGWGAYDAARRYATERRQFDRPLAEHQGVQFKFADMATHLDAGWLLTLRAASMKEAKVPFSKEASMAKVFATEKANEIAREAVQVHGGYGYTEEFDVARAYRDARVTQIYEGTSEIQRIVIAREILKELR